MNIDRPTNAQIPALRQLWKQAFGDSDSFLDGFFATGFSFDRCRCLHLDGKLAAALYWFDCRWQGKKVAYIYAVATDISFRGKGLCRALLEDTHRQLQATGYAGATLVPGSKELFALYEKLGYRSFCPMDTVTVAAGETAVEVTSLSPDNYYLRRQCRLGSNALLQSRTVTDFFETYGSFYRCGDEVFAVSREADTLYFQEYLGDPAKLPGIVAALGASKGIVRLPGGEDSAMYLPLDHDPALPDYLGMPLN